MPRYIPAAMICLVMFASHLCAEPVDFFEDWEGHSVGGSPVSPWFVDPHMSAGSLMVVAGANYNITPGGDNGFLVNYSGFNGKDAGNQIKLVPDGHWIEATDADRLKMTYLAKSSIAQLAEWYFEIALGDVHAPRLADVGLENPLPSPIPVIAYCKPMLVPGDGTKTCYCFDGRQWRACTFMNYNNAWNEFLMWIGTNTITVETQSPFPRAYLGGFDRISIYTLDFIASGYTVIDQISISGGDHIHPLGLTPEDDFTIAGEPGGLFFPPCKTYTLTNNVSTPITWHMNHAEDWISIATHSGTLDAGNSVDIDVCINANADALPLGDYMDQMTLTNLTYGDIQTRDVQLFVGNIDTFTELFDANNDLDHQTLTLTPDGSIAYYNVCTNAASAFPVEPAGGAVLSVLGDEYIQVVLESGAQVSLYGNAYSSFYVGANGYITFGSGDTDATESLGDHFRLPRISGLFTNLGPTLGAVTWKQLLDRAAVTWQNVAQVGVPGSNSFQIEMFYDGRIRMTWLALAATDGLAGVSRGNGTPGSYVPSDLSDYDECPTEHHPADYDADGDVDLEDFGQLQACLTGENVYVVNTFCGVMDLDQDADVDRWDIQKLLGCMSGAGIPVIADCQD